MSGGSILVDLSTGVIQADLGSGNLQIELAVIGSMDVGEHSYWAQMRLSADGRGTKWELIVPNDTTPLPHQYKQILCSAAGTCVMKDTVGTSLTLTMAANSLLLVVPTIIAVASTGTFYGILE